MYADFRLASRKFIKVFGFILKASVFRCLVANDRYAEIRCYNIATQTE